MAGIPFGTAGSTNVLHVVRLVGDELDRYKRKAQRGSRAGTSSGDLAGEEADRADLLAPGAAPGFAVQPDRPQQGVERLGAARKQAADDTREHVAAARNAEPRRAAAVGPDLRPGVTTWLVTPLTRTRAR